MASDAERIKALRERTGKSSHEIAAIAGLGEMEYFDLEFHADELVTVPSLAKIRRLAEALGVPTSALFCDDPNSVQGHTSYAELVSLVMDRLAAGISRKALEEEIGWDLDAFLERNKGRFRNMASSSSRHCAPVWVPNGWPHFREGCPTWRWSRRRPNEPVAPRLSAKPLGGRDGAGGRRDDRECQKEET